MTTSMMKAMTPILIEFVLLNNGLRMILFLFFCCDTKYKNDNCISVQTQKTNANSVAQQIGN